jgi:mRNA interferase RelE/StbE
MAFQITITKEFKAQLRKLSARQQRIVLATISATLQDQPTTPTKAIKALRPNPFAKFQLHVGEWRVLYNVLGDEVVLVALGQKVRNKLIVEGEEFHGHQDNPVEPSGNGR